MFILNQFQGLTGFAPNPIGRLSSRPPNTPAPKLKNYQFGPNGPNWNFLAHTLFLKSVC